MLRALRTKLSLMFHPSTLTTHQFEKKTTGPAERQDLFGAYIGESAEFSTSRIWAEARPVSEGLYAVTKKQHDTHRHLFVSGKSKFEEGGLRRTFNGENKTMFSHDEAIAILKDLEKDFENDNYTARPKQPFKKAYLYAGLRVPAKKLRNRHVLQLLTGRGLIIY